MNKQLKMVGVALMMAGIWGAAAADTMMKTDGMINESMAGKKMATHAMSDTPMKPMMKDTMHDSINAGDGHGMESEGDHAMGAAQRMKMESAMKKDDAMKMNGAEADTMMTDPKHGKGMKHGSMMK